MAFLDGLLSGIGVGQQFQQQQLAQDRFDESVRQFDENYKLQQKNYSLNLRDLRIREQAAPGLLTAQELSNDKLIKENRYEDNDRYIGMAADAGFIDQASGGLRFDLARSAQNILEGGRVNDELVLMTLNRDPDLPKGFKYDKVVRAPLKGGGIMVQGTYEDGKKGVLTSDGRISGDADVAVLSADMVAGLMEDEYRTNIRGNSNLGASSSVVQSLITMGVGKANAAELVNEETALNTLQTQLQGEIDRLAIDPQTGEKDIGMSRAFRGVLASATSPQEKMTILIDQANQLGIQVPDILTKALADQSIDATQRQAGTTPSDLMGVEPIQDGQTVAQPAPNVAQSTTPATSPIAEKNRFGLSRAYVRKQQSTDDLDSQIAAAERRLKNANPRSRAAAKRRLEDLQAQKASLSPAQPPAGQGGLSSLPDQTAEIRKAAEALEKGIFAKLGELSPEEIAERAASGDLKATAQDEANLAAVLQAAGVQTLADIRTKLPTKAQEGAYAWLMTIAPSDSARENIRAELSNLRSGSGRADASLLDLQNLDVNRQNALTQWRRLGLDERKFALALREYEEVTRPKAALAINKHFFEVEKHDWDVSETLGVRIREHFKQAKYAVYGSDDGTPDGNLNDSPTFDKARFNKEFAGADGAFTKMYQDFRKAPAAQKPQMHQALNSMVSLGFQTLAESEEYGPLFANLMPDGEIDHIGGSDIFLNRLAVDEVDGRGKPKTYKVINPATQLQTDETIPASVIKNLFGASGYTFVENEILQGPGSLAATNRDLAAASR